MSYQNIYKQQSVATAPPGKLLIMLFDGLLRFLSQAKTAINERQIEPAHKALVRAQDIVLELRSTLDHEKAPELCESLSDLYTYFYSSLVEANRTKTVDKIDEILPGVQELRDAFSEANNLAAEER